VGGAAQGMITDSNIQKPLRAPLKTCRKIKKRINN